MKNVHRLTEGAIILAIFSVILLLTIYVPLLGIVTNLFLALPFMLFAAKNDGKSTLVFLIASLFISFIVGTILAIPLTLAFGSTGAIIGYMIRTKKTRSTIFLAGSIVFLINIVLQYAVSVAFFHIDMIDELLDLFRQFRTQFFDILDSTQQSPEQEKAIVKLKDRFNEFLTLSETLMPSVFLMSSFMMVFIIQLVSIPIIKRFGVKIEGWTKMNEISLPKSILWYYLLTMLAVMALHPEKGTYVYLAIMNLTYILQLLMVFQGLTFIFYFCDKKSLPKALPVAAVVLTFVMPFFLYIVRILGIIDLGFDLRNRQSSKE